MPWHRSQMAFMVVIIGVFDERELVQFSFTYVV
jgi:hypothetical protein